ncbi:30S ribosomal protein S6, partial [Candidatus Saccharibacteria bacterium]|nr:30S ribosomal protein S6 [Candidatus Saccharibacteria bacterium]
SINAQNFAVYYYFDVQLPVAAPAKISSTLNITDEVLRYLLVSVDERKAKYEARRKARKSSDEEEQKEEVKGE